ncbi:GSCFA domain-containing protein [Bacteroidota bacterium]
MSNSTFRTVLKSKNNFKSIHHESSILLFGSCFSENIGKKLAYYKFDTTTNPYGTLFHPLAIEKAISDCVSLKKYNSKELIFHNELYHSFHHHSDFSCSTEKEVLTNINQTIVQNHDRLKKASHLIITLGTAWVYKHLKTNTAVANCHKIPQQEFSKELLSSEEIYQSLKRIQKTTNLINPKIKIIYTLSPVRHLKDGISENSLSKALLLAGIHKATKEENIFYYPAYEIMMDDLRDYRFYGSDMIHPNETAIEYIWSNFVNEWISTSETVLTKIDIIQKGLAHKAFNPTSTAHLNFIKKLKRNIELLENEIPIKF